MGQDHSRNPRRNPTRGPKGRSRAGGCTTCKEKSVFDRESVAPAAVI
jgi:hypothetical protein